MENNHELYLADFIDLALHECGRERCQPGKTIKLDVKDYHLFHFIVSGTGTFIYQGQTYNLKKGDLFYIPSHHTASYFPSHDDPWYYVWVGFDGAKAKTYLSQMNLSKVNPIFHAQKDLNLDKLFNTLADQYNHAKYLNIEVLATFLQILYKLMISGNKKQVLLTTNQTHIKMVRQFIENNFQFNIKVSDISDSLSISPNYLANVFKQELGISPKTMLTEYRMKKACEYLTTTQLKIKEIAKKIGYHNALHFSTQFKKMYKMSPLMYKEKKQIKE